MAKAKRKVAAQARTRRTGVTKREVPARRSAPPSGSPANPWTDLGRDGKTLYIGHFLTFQIMRLANAAKANVTRKYLAEFGLSIPEWRLLAMTMRHEPVRFSVLVANSSIDKGQASRTIQGLARRGLILTRTIDGRTRRSRVSRESGTPVVLTVTPKGRKLYAAVIPVARRNQGRLLHLLTRDERRTLYVSLNKLFAAIGDRDAFI